MGHGGSIGQHGAHGEHTQGDAVLYQRLYQIRKGYGKQGDRTAYGLPVWDLCILPIACLWWLAFDMARLCVSGDIKYPVTITNAS